MQKTSYTKKIAVIGMLCALAYICMFVFRIKVGFLTFDAKDAVIAITSLIYGPLWGGLTAVLVPVLEFLTVSDTGVYGLIMNTLSSVTFAAVCGSIYKYKRSFSGAIIGVIASAFSVTAVMMVANLFVTPLFMGVERSTVVGMIPTLLLPFNAVKATLNAALTLALYKPFTTALRQARLLPQSQAPSFRLHRKSVVLLVCSLIVAVAAIVFLMMALSGEFELFRSFATATDACIG